MWGYGYNMMGWGWLVGAAFVVLIVVAVIVVVRLVPGRAHHAEAAPPSPVGTRTPRQVLDERYARGDIATEEYLERVKHLGSA
ncbi:SHOCT domain-containing protein [Subtercola frigoramans]|uniref:Membrane protein n=2 Tax=Subtercola frigoramans TaxID=120298 RepID=A0ABS2L3A9_9MICO|nr:SHOCT domain-containing protein [Subtercola frigoramans]MBM7471504.1 putative membrane protein [Subtercola frigoramans]